MCQHRPAIPLCKKQFAFSGDFYNLPKTLAAKIKSIKAESVKRQPRQTHIKNSAKASPWEGGNIEVRARLVPKFLWTTGSIDVFLNGVRIVSSGGKFKISTTTRAEFNHHGSQHTVELQARSARVGTFPYKLLIDGVLIADSEVFIDNPRILLLPWILLILEFIVIVWFLGRI